MIGRIENDKFMLDLRSLLDDDVETLIKIINETEEKMSLIIGTGRAYRPRKNRSYKGAKRL